MPQDIKIWELDDKKLKEVKKEKLDLENRLEEWIANDISTLSNNLLVIGKQVNTDFGGTIDLLCIDNNGDLVVIELKRDKTPREITAQVLDYASWVCNLSNEKIHEMANSYLGNRGQLDEVFEEKFGIELPDILNEHHKMLIVASEIDESSERIVNYLSNSYGVNINVATFQYFKENGKEFLARVFLIEPTEVDYKTQTKTNSKRKPPLTYDQLEEMAEKNGVGKIYNRLLSEAKSYFEITAPTRSSVALIGLVGKDRSRRTICGILPGVDDRKNSLFFEIRVAPFSEYFKIDLEKVKKSLPPCLNEDDYGWDKKYYGGYFANETEVDNFLEVLKQAKK